MDKLVCRGEIPISWLLVDVDDDDAVATSGDETADESTPADDEGNDQANKMDGAAELTGGQLDDSGSDDDGGVTPLQPTGQGQPPAYL